MKENAQFFTDEAERIKEQKIDEQLKKLAGKSEPKLPEGYEERMEKLLENLPAKRARRMPRQWCAVAAVFAVVLLAGVSVVNGTIHYLNSRMNEMSDSEISDYNEAVQTMPIEADSYSRELTEEERERMAKLQEEYLSEGRYPESRLPVVGGTEELSDDKPAYIQDTGTYYLPEHRLSDEELLELLEFRYKRDYSVEKSNQNARTMGTETKIAASIEEMAAEAVQETLGIDVSGLYCETQLSPQKTLYSLEYKKDNHILCYVAVDAATNQIVSLEEVLSEQTQSDAEYSESALEEGAGLAKACLTSSVWGNPDVVRITAWYYVRQNERTVAHSKIRYVLELSDGEEYVCTYHMLLQRIVALDYSNGDNIELYRMSENMQKKKGLTEESVDLTNGSSVKYDVTR